jgi:hypothetical protein
MAVQERPAHDDASTLIQTAARRRFIGDDAKLREPCSHSQALAVGTLEEVLTAMTVGWASLGYQTQLAPFAGVSDSMMKGDRLWNGSEGISLNCCWE